LALAGGVTLCHRVSPASALPTRLPFHFQACPLDSISGDLSGIISDRVVCIWGVGGEIRGRGIICTICSTGSGAGGDQAEHSRHTDNAQDDEAQPLRPESEWPSRLALGQVNRHGALPCGQPSALAHSRSTRAAVTVVTVSARQRVLKRVAPAACPLRRGARWGGTAYRGAPPRRGPAPAEPHAPSLS
jgi:hypothetical protein